MTNQAESSEQLRQQLAALQQEIAACTARKQAEEELAQSKAVLRAAMESLPFDFWAIGPDGRYILANAVCKANWGELVGRRPEDHAGTKENLAIWLENNRHAFAGEKVEGEVEFTLRGRKRFYHNVITPIRDGEQILGILGVNVDISERKEAELALRQAHDELEQKVQERTAALARANEQLRHEVEQRRRAEEELILFRKFAEASGQGFGMTELSGRITYLNPALCRFCGEERPEDVVGKHVTAYYPEEYKQRREKEVVPALVQEGHWQAELTIIPRQGKVTPALHHWFLIRDDQGNPIRIATVVTDITARKEAEEALQQRAAELQAICDGMVDGLLIADIDTKQFLRANFSICEMLGYSEEELLHLSVMKIHPAEDVPRILEVFQAQMEGRLRLNENAPVLRKDGSVFYADIAAARLTYAGRPCAIGIFRDVTERKQAEEALRTEQRVLKHLLQASDHERQLIAYDIHDGLAQQLAAAIMQFQVFDHLKDKNPEEAARVHQTAVTMLRQGHLEARRLISGVRPPILDESGIMAAIAHLVHDQSSERGPRIEFRSKAKFHRLAPVLENAVYRIVQEGLANACKHSQSQKVRVALVQHGDQVRVEIADWGIGFAWEKVKEGCYGIEGIRQRARLLGGRATIKSAPGKGTSIRVELPLALPE